VIGQRGHVLGLGLSETRGILGFTVMKRNCMHWPPTHSQSLRLQFTNFLWFCLCAIYLYSCFLPKIKSTALSLSSIISQTNTSFIFEMCNIEPTFDMLCYGRNNYLINNLCDIRNLQRKNRYLYKNENNKEIK